MWCQKIVRSQRNRLGNEILALLWTHTTALVRKIFTARSHQEVFRFLMHGVCLRSLNVKQDSCRRNRITISFKFSCFRPYHWSALRLCCSSRVGVWLCDADVVGLKRAPVVLTAGVPFQDIELATQSQEPRQRTKATAYKQIEFRSMLEQYHGMLWGTVKPRHRYVHLQTVIC